MMYPMVLDLAAEEAPLRVPVAATCRVSGFSRQAFYRGAKILSRNGTGMMPH